MAENTYIIKGNDIVFGIPDGTTVPWGVLTSIKRKPSKTVAEFPGEDGEIGTRVSYQSKEVYSLEVLRGGKKGVKVSTLLVPALDDIVELNGKYMIVSDLDDSCAQGDAQKYTIELTFYPAIDMTPPPAPASNTPTTSK